MTNQIQIGPRFFQIEKRNYSNWYSALIRELLQNSVDSRGCTRIDLSTLKLDNGNVLLSCQDNGAGMSRETLENVFLVMGETGKNDAYSVGGYGKARVLLCWAQHNYKIISSDYVLEGCGAQYEIKERKNALAVFHDGFVRGCRFEIETDDINWNTTIREVLSKCSLSQIVSLNGEIIRNNIRKGKLVRELSFANVYVNKSATPQFLVRVNGCWMFDKYTEVKAQIVVELNPENSRDSMTANRDGLQYSLDRELQAFLNEIASDSRSSLKDKTRHFKRLVNKDVTFKAKPKNGMTDGKMTPNGNMTIDEYVAAFRSMGSGNQAIYNSGTNPVDYEYLPAYLKDPLLQSMMILNESNNAKRVNLINNFYHPEKWTTRASTRYQLLREWFAICEIVMEELATWRNEEYSFSVGWVFGDPEDDAALAKHVKEDETHYLLINPINGGDKLRYSVNNKDDHYSLIVLACHEVSHCIFHSHNEDFASLMTDLTSRALKRRKEILDAVKRAKE